MIEHKAIVQKNYSNGSDGDPRSIWFGEHKHLLAPCIPAVMVVQCKISTCLNNNKKIEFVWTLLSNDRLWSCWCFRDVKKIGCQDLSSGKMVFIKEFEKKKISIKRYYYPYPPTIKILEFLSHIYDNIYSQAGHIEGAVACYGRYKHPPSSLGPGPSLPLRTHNQVFSTFLNALPPLRIRQSVSESWFQFFKTV